MARLGFHIQKGLVMEEQSMDTTETPAEVCEPNWRQRLEMLLAEWDRLAPEPGGFLPREWIERLTGLPWGDVRLARFIDRARRCLFDRDQEVREDHRLGLVRLTEQEKVTRVEAQNAQTARDSHRNCVRAHRINRALLDTRDQGRLDHATRRNARNMLAQRHNYGDVFSLMSDDTPWREASV